MTRTIRLGGIVMLLLGVSSVGWSQTLRQHNWLFGNSTNGIKFNRATNLATAITNKAVPFGTGGSSVATDPSNANLLFYTDGATIYDADHLPMPGGTGLNAATSSNQPTAISPIPGQPNKYYVFTNTATPTSGGTISYTVVDLNLFGNAAFPAPALGDVETGKKNVAIPGLIDRAEGMMVVPDDTGENFWLITQEVNSLNFSAVLINAATYTAGTFTILTSSGPVPFPTTAANLSYHPRLKKIAVSPQDVDTDAVILNFNDNITSGAITFDRIIYNSAVSATNNQGTYDIEWSNNGRYLYLSRHGDTGISANVFQYNYPNSSGATNITLAPVITSPIFRSYGLQMAPDSSIYHLYQSTSGGPFLVGRIESPDSVATKVAYNATPFGTTNFNATQFPSFAPKDTIDLTLSFTSAGNCQNTPTSFYPKVKPGADSLTWKFGDGNVGGGFGPVHTYEAAGSFDVVLIAFYGSQVDSVQQSVTINAFPLQIQLVQDTTACKCELPVNKPKPVCAGDTSSPFSVKVQVQGGTPASIVWSNGDLGDTLFPDSAGYYYVVVTDAGGCSAYAGVNVKEYGLQDQTFNKWYFGNRAGIDFNVTPPIPLSESAMNAPEGCSIVCDRNGETIFYTDGQTVYDKTHAVIASNIGGNAAATQSALIVAVTGDETLYYIFTTQAINGTDSLILKYSLFDLKQNAGKGAVVKQNIALFAKSTERITSNGRWLIAHEYGNNVFRAYSISPAGIGNPVYSAIGSDHSFKFQTNGEGYMKLGPRNNLAVPLSNPGTSNHIELFTFNDSTGSVTNYRNIDLKEPNGQIYGVEFSPGGNKLFATVKVNSGSSHIFEYFLDSLERPFFKQKISPAAELGAVQRAPNGQLYVAVNNAGNNTSLGQITANDDTTRISSFVLNGFALAAGTNSRLGLPNFIQINSNAVGGPAISIEGICAGDSTRFTGTPTDQIDEFQWSILRGVTNVHSSTEATFQLLLTPGNYRANLRLTNRCGLDTLMTQTFTIFDTPAAPGGAAALCSGPVLLDANPPNVAGLTYLWSTGETTKTISVNEQGVVNATVTDTNGCFSTGNFLVADNRPILDLGPDLTICEDNNTPGLNAQNAGATYAWTINGTAASNTQAIAVDTDVPGVFTYAVRVTDPVTTCFTDESKTYTIKVSPNFNFSGVDPTGACGSATGSITLQLNASSPAGGPLYQYFISGPSTAQDDIDQSAPLTLTIPGRVAGTYSAIVTDQISGCTISASWGLNDDNVFTITPSISGANCDPVVYNVATTGTAPLDYTITNSGTGAIADSKLNHPNANFTTQPLSAGIYFIQVTDNNNCISTNSLTVAPDVPATVTLTPNLCDMTIQATAISGATYAWTSTPATAIASGAATRTISLTPNTGNAAFTVTVTPPPGACPATESITLTVGNITTPVLSQTNECSTSVLLTASPNGSFTYRWYVNGTFDALLAGNQQVLTLAENGDTYGVEIYDPQTGCTTTRTNRVVSVVGPVDATLTSTPPCQDGQPITLTAASTATGTLTYTWSRNNVTLPTVTTPTTDQTEEGTYRVVIAKATCSATATLPIVRNPLPVGILPNRAIICNDPDNVDPDTKSIDLDPGDFNAYNWFKNEVTLAYTDRVYTAESEGIYTVELTNEYQCVAEDETEVLNECLPVVEAPNAFRPGSSVPANKFFKIFSFFITDENFNVFIYNRWGELVFTANDRDFTWNGGYNNNAGQPLPPGTYSYVVQYVSAFRPDKGVQEKRGGVALLR